MFLPDFLEFEPFNQLRLNMGAEELGDFVFFDPKRHVTGLERSSLGREGLEVEPSALRVLNDFTLAYKDCRVLLYPARVHAASSEREVASGDIYHLADCPTVVGLRSLSPASLNTGLWRICSNGEALAGSSRVCRECLQRLRYQHFDAVRQRHRDYSERVEQTFELHAFFERYPSHPLNEQEQVPVF